MIFGKSTSNQFGFVTLLGEGLEPKEKVNKRDLEVEREGEATIDRCY